MVKSVPTGSHMFFDQYLATIDLMNELLANDLPAIETKLRTKSQAAAKRQTTAKRGQSHISISDQRVLIKQSQNGPKCPLGQVALEKRF